MIDRHRLPTRRSATRRALRAILLAAVVTGVVLAAACGAEEGASPAEPRPAPAPSAEPPPLADGRYFGYLESLEAQGEPKMGFDAAEFFVGDEAIVEAEKDGVEDVGDFYLRNRESGVVSLPVAADASVTRIGGGEPVAESKPGDLAGLAASFALTEGPSLYDDYRGSFSQYWITVEDGVVVAIDEQYLP